ncbi:MAG: hypothetical protein JRD69_02720 [Deltaproteobacteria bacterium]|nr:hypothetical protein [Deltaproteobacteria bacterium]
MSALTWVAFTICAVAVASHYVSTGDSRFLLYAIPGLIMLLVIPMSLAWMSRRSFTQASEQFGTEARSCKIGKIDPKMIGDVVRISGEVQKISFRWLNRPHFHIKDETAGMRVIMFTAPSNKIFVGDAVEAIGIVMKHLLTRNRLIISAVSVKRIED